VVEIAGVLSAINVELADTRWRFRKFEEELAASILRDEDVR